MQRQRKENKISVKLPRVSHGRWRRVPRRRAVPSPMYSKCGASSSIVMLFLLSWIYEMQLEVSLEKSSVTDGRAWLSPVVALSLFPIFYRGALAYSVTLHYSCRLCLHVVAVLAQNRSLPDFHHISAAPVKCIDLFDTPVTDKERHLRSFWSRLTVLCLGRTLRHRHALVNTYWRWD